MIVYSFRKTGIVIMAALVADYNSSGEEEEEVERTAEVPSVDYEESSKVISSLRERFPLDSAPVVPNKVSLAACHMCSN